MIERIWRRVAAWACPTRAVRLRGWPPTDIAGVFRAGLVYGEIDGGRLVVVAQPGGRAPYAPEPGETMREWHRRWVS